MNCERLSKLCEIIARRFLYETGAQDCNAVRHGQHNNAPPAGAGASQTHIYVWDRLVLSVGPGRENGKHRHFGAIVIVAPDAPMRLTTREQAWTAQAALVAPNAWHSLDCRGSRALTVLIGPDHAWWRYVKPLLTEAPIAPLDLHALAAVSIDWDALLEGRADCAEARETVRRILCAFGGEAQPHRLDERIEEIVQLLHADIAHPPRIAELSRRTGLSAFTLMRRFKRELGVRIGEYVLWRRLMAALASVDGRKSIAEIAQRTGFYDQAHLTRTVRRMVELPPSFINDFKQTRVHVCSGEARARGSGREA